MTPYIYVIHSDVCQQHQITTLGVPLRLATMYQCYEGDLWSTQWINYNDSDNWKMDCSGEPSNMVDNFELDEHVECDGVWNCPNALVREYSVTNNCSDDLAWNEYAYIVDSCQMVANNGIPDQLSAKLVCDEVTGISFELYDDLNCSGNLMDTHNYLKGDNECSNENADANRKLVECVNRSNDEKPEWRTQSPTPAPTPSSRGKTQEEETWMIVGIVVICLLVIAVVIVIVVYCQNKDKGQQYSATSTSEMAAGGYHD